MIYKRLLCVSYAKKATIASSRKVNGELLLTKLHVIEIARCYVAILIAAPISINYAGTLMSLCTSSQRRTLRTNHQFFCLSQRRLEIAIVCPPFERTGRNSPGYVVFNA